MMRTVPLATTRTQSVRVPWTDEELELLRKTFAHCLHSGGLPGYAAIAEAQNRFPVLQKRSPAQVKSC